MCIYYTDPMSIGINGEYSDILVGTESVPLRSFTINNEYTRKEDGPIPEAVLLKLRPSGEFITSWGGGVFYMPHGLTVSSTAQYWVTDVARHQLLKTFNDGQKILALGVSFVPGGDENHFCKPTDVALDETNGVFYIADG